MRKTWTALAAVAAMAGTVVAAAPAHAQRFYYGPDYYYPPQSYTYGGAPAAVADPSGPCYWQRQRVWDGAAWRVRSVRVCG